MTTKTEYQPGTPSWVDLSTTDPAAAKDFYGPLFGWTYDDQPTDDPANPYTLAFLNGQVVAGLMAQPPEMKAAGAPPMWSTYVTFDVMDAGRMAVAADPTGAVFCIWQAKNHIGAAVVNEPGSLSWNELLTPDVDRAAAFYKAVFGWEANNLEMGPMRYTEFRLGGEPVAGGTKPPMEGIPPSWGVYFTVADTDATVADAKSRGAQVLSEPMDIPPGRFAVLMDPQGAAFNVIKLATPAG
jgi:predicted enzyme related to lactoylglutathione lyase